MPARGTPWCEAPTGAAAWVATTPTGATPARCRSAGLLPRASALDRPGGQTAHEVPLEGEEDDDRDDHRQDAAGRDDVPALALLADEVVLDGDRHGSVLTGPDEHEGDEQVVPDPEELEDGER